jgi:hypothetical protein
VAFGNRVIGVAIVGDASKLLASFREAAGGANKFNRDMERTFRGVLAGSGAFRSLGRSVAFASASFLGGVGFVQVVKSSVEAASNLEEQLSKSNVVFGASAKAVEAWAKTTVNSMGLAEDQALQTASSFGALLRPLGITGQEAARQSEQLTQLGADLASFYNTDVKSALDALQSGLTGQVRPLRAYGVLLSATRVNQEALTETGKKHASQLTDQEKVIARLAIIYKDTAQAQGDFARTSGGLANQQRILQANVRQLQIALGVALVPAITDVVKKINDWLAKSGNQKRVQDDLREAVDKTIGAIRTISGVIKTVVGDLGGWHQALIVLGGAFLGFKAAGIGSAIAVSTANVIAAGITADAWKAALISTGWGVFAVAAGIAATEVIAHWQAVKQFFQEFWIWMEETEDKTLLAMVEAFSHLPKILGGGPFQRAKAALQADLQDLEAQATQTAQAVGGAVGVPPGLTGPQTAPTAVTGPPTAPAVTAGAAGGGRRGVTASQRNQWFDAMINRQLGRVQDITSLRGQIARLGQIAQLIRNRLAVTKDITRQLTLEDKLADVVRQQRGTRTDLTDQIKQKAQDASDAQRAWLDFAVERAQATKTLTDDRKAYQAIEKWLKGKIRQEGRTLDLVRDLWETRQKIRDLNKQNIDPLAGLAQVSSRQLANILAAGTGLDVTGRRRLVANIGGADIQPVHVHVNIDGREVAQVVTKHQARATRRTAKQTSGFHG